MDLLISDTFTASLGRLTVEEQKLVKTTTFDLQVDASAPGLQMHRVEKAKDREFWSVRVSRDLRIIVHRSDQQLLLCYVDHHNKAYAWAERRRLEQHPVTGAMQMVQLRETIREVPVIRYRDSGAPLLLAETPPAAPAKQPFLHLTPAQLLQYGVPDEWVSIVQQADEDAFFAFSAALPAEASEALLNVAVGIPVETPQSLPPDIASRIQSDPFQHPDSQRRFRLVATAAELQTALDYPWDQWAVFLHPSQRALIERRWNGPVRAAGSAGTGKTIVAVHRAVFLARARPESRVLLTTFSRPLAALLAGRVDILAGASSEVRQRISVQTVSETALQVADAAGVSIRPVVAADVLTALLQESRERHAAARFSLNFLLDEWRDIVDDMQVRTWERYRTVQRVGRRVRLTEAHRKQIWQVMEAVLAGLSERGLTTVAAVCEQLTAVLPGPGVQRFDHVVVDEAQDVGFSELRFLAALAVGGPEALFFTGDPGQQIFQSPFSWLSAGVDIRGRSRTLKVNYRTSQQIRELSDRLLPDTLTDGDGVEDVRNRTISVFEGPVPEIVLERSESAETACVSRWLGARLAENFLPRELAVIVRTEQQFSRAEAAIRGAGLVAAPLFPAGPEGSQTDGVALLTMPVAKGLEYRGVAVMACDDNLVPLEERVATAGSPVDHESLYATERHLLYVACTRARDRLLLTAVHPGSEFLDDMKQSRSFRSGR
jgi:hypothetical protein